MFYFDCIFPGFTDTSAHFYSFSIEKQTHFHRRQIDDIYSWTFGWNWLDTCTVQTSSLLYFLFIYWFYSSFSLLFFLERKEELFRNDTMCRICNYRVTMTTNETINVNEALKLCLSTFFSVSACTVIVFSYRICQENDDIATLCSCIAYSISTYAYLIGAFRFFYFFLITLWYLLIFGLTDYKFNG